MTDGTPTDQLPGWSSRAGGRLLLVETDADTARMLEVRLAREGHDVVVARTGQEALRQTLAETFDVALVDRGLPDMAADDLMGQLRAQFTPFETLLTTREPTVEIFEDALRKGAFDLLVKPFASLELVAAKVAQATAKVRAERERDELARMLQQQTTGAPSLPPAEEEPLPALIDLDGMSGVDPLTGLPNKRAAEERFRTEAARALRYDRPMCVALASVDDLARVVERFGSDVADGVIRGIVQLFGGLVRDVDFIARRQGGEFFFLFPETTKESGVVVIDRIRAKLVQTSFSDHLGEASSAQGLEVSASFGIAGLPHDTMNAELLKTAAETALARAKSLGGNRVVPYDPSLARR